MNKSANMVNNQSTIVHSSKKSFIQATSQSASCCIIPPEEIWDQIQEIRSVNDKSYKKWMPHINFLFPFIPVEQFSQGVEMLRNNPKFTKIHPFRVRLSNIYFAENSKYLWVKPEMVCAVQELAKKQSSKQCKNERDNKEQDLLILLQAAVQHTFPHCSHTGGDEFVPHLTLGQFSKDTIKEALKAIQEQWQPMEFEVNEVAMISRDGPDQPFRIVETVTLSNIT